MPAWIVSLPAVQWIMASWPFHMFRRYLFRPLVTLVVGAVLAFFADGIEMRNSTLATFICACIVLNSRFGRNVDELVTDWVVQTWHRLRIHVFTALFRFIMDVFNRLLEAIERVLYTVDEWLRFGRASGPRPPPSRRCWRSSGSS